MYLPWFAMDVFMPTFFSLKLSDCQHLPGRDAHLRVRRNGVEIFHPWMGTRGGCDLWRWPRDRETGPFLRYGSDGPVPCQSCRLHPATGCGCQSGTAACCMWHMSEGLGTALLGSRCVELFQQMWTQCRSWNLSSQRRNSAPSGRANHENEGEIQ